MELPSITARVGSPAWFATLLAFVHSDLLRAERFEDSLAESANFEPSMDWPASLPGPANLQAPALLPPTD